MRAAVTFYTALFLFSSLLTFLVITVSRF